MHGHTILLPLPNGLYRCISRALLGEVFAQVVAVAAAWTDAHDFTLRVYLDRAATDEDAAGLDILLAEISADFPLDYFRSCHAEILTTTATMQHLDALSDLLFARSNKTRFTH